MLNLKGKKVTIIGGKRSGMALAKLIVRFQGQAKISEKSKPDSLPEEFHRWAQENKVLLEFNGHTRTFVEDSDLIVLSPGVAINAEPVFWGIEKKIPVLGEIEFAFQFCSKPVIAITGSNGKTTTVTLVRDVLKEAGYKVCLCGNVGDPFSNHVYDLEAIDYFVLEVSSFQMEVLLAPDSEYRRENTTSDFSFKGFKPQVAAILNFSQNHLDRHKDMDEYFDAKKRIFLNQDSQNYAVLDYQNSRLKALGPQLKSKTVFYNSPEIIKKFGIVNPNQLAVLAVADSLGIEEKTCRKIFNNFRGVEHRLEWVRDLDGVDYVNDSKATTVEAGEWALKSIEKPIVMLVGGRDKNLDFIVIKDLVQKKVKRMIVFGEARDKLKKVFEGVVKIDEASSFEEAVVKSREVAVKGDCIVLSPMCASFDMFSSYEERGQVFKQLVKNLK